VLARYLTSIMLTGPGTITMPVCGGEPHVTSALIAMPVPVGTDSSGDSCFPSTNIEISSLSLSASYAADYAVLAPGLTRSRFSDVRFSAALLVALSIPYGWINRVESCTFSANGW